MKRTRLCVFFISISILTTLIVFVSSCSAAEQFNLSGRPNLTPMEMRGWYFLDYRMHDGDGIIYYLASPRKKSKTSVVESMGQAMEYLALIGDRFLFDRYAEATERHFKDPKDYYYHWEITVKNGKGAGVTALIDDIRIFKAYDIANGKGMGDYSNKLKELAAEIYFLETDGGSPVSYYSNEGKAKSSQVNLFYLDIDVMRRLAVYDSRWKEVAVSTKKILDGMPPNDFGFYPVRYDIEDDEYISQPNFNMVENLYTGIFAMSAGCDVDPYAKFLKREAASGVLYNIYGGDGEPAENYESVAVYALAARFMYLYGDMEAARFFYDKMLAAQIEGDSTFLGGFSLDGNESVYAFDQLEALLTIRLTDL